MDTVKNSSDLRKIANRLRIDILKMITKAGSGHPGGSLSVIDIMTVIYYSKLDHSPDYGFYDKRDRFILSKGHAAPALYAILSSFGYFDPAYKESLRKFDGILSGHPHAGSTAGVEASTGSLGQGLSIANGIALALKLDKNFKNKVYCVLGDGEIQEGQIWEAAMTSSHHKLDNLIAIVDANLLQIDGLVASIKNIEPISDKFKSFGWSVKEIDGHDFDQISEALDWADNVKGSPSMIVARTVKGKGVSFMEGKVNYHGVANTEDELKVAIAELERVI